MPWDAHWHHQQTAFWWIVVVLVVLVGVCMWRGRCRPSEGTESPEQALKRRYAKGEIDEKTYKHMLAELRK